MLPIARKVVLLAIFVLLATACSWKAVKTESGMTSYIPPWTHEIEDNWKTDPEFMHNRVLTKEEHDAALAAYCAEHPEDWCFEEYKVVTIVKFDTWDGPDGEAGESGDSAGDAAGDGSGVGSGC